MHISSARPDALDRFAARSRDADQQLRTYDGRLRAAYDDFRASLGWGTFDADSLLSVFRTYIELNETDAEWVRTIAIAFRQAGGDGSVNWLPDAAIAASLRAAGLHGGRRAVTFDLPVAHGFPATTGYVDDPVNTASGNFVALELDLELAPAHADLALARVYNSRSERTGAFGDGWASWADVRLRTVDDGVEYSGPDGQVAVFPRADGGYGRVLGVPATLRPLPSGHALDWFDGRRWQFDVAGRPELVWHGDGTDVRLTWEGGRLARFAHGGGTNVSVEWADERIRALRSSDGRQVTFAYEDGTLSAAERPEGARAYERGPDGRVAAVVDADGVVEVRNRYDDAGRVLEQWSPFGRRTLFAYLPGHVTVTGDGADTPANTYLHDDAGHLIGVVDGHGERLSVSYDADGNPIAVTERNGAVTLQEWDDRGHLVKRTLPSGAELAWAYDEQDRPVSVTADGGGTSTVRYAGDARAPVEVVDAEGGITCLRVEAGLVREVVDPDGVTVRLDFDEAGRLVTAIDGEGNAARLERAGAGRIVAAVSPLGRRTEFAYDAGGRPAERRDPGGGVWRAEHSRAGRVLATTDPSGARVELAYGDHGEVSALRDPVGVEVGWSYDAFGNLAAIAGPGGRTWQLEHDALMRLTSVVEPTGARWTREYDVSGVLVAATDPAGVRVTAEIDPAGRVVGVADAATSSAFDLDGFGRVVEERRPDGTRVRLTRDSCGRCTVITAADGATTRIEYTPGGRVRRVVGPSGRAEEREYDARGHLAAIVDGAGARWTFRYDADGALVERGAPDGSVDRYAYDDAGRLVRHAPRGGAPVTLAYDAAGRVVERTDAAGGTRRYRYDAAGRLVEAIDERGGATAFFYDADGRLVRTVDPGGHRAVRDYDAAGHLARTTDPLGISTVHVHDAAGRLAERRDGAGRTLRLERDASGRVAAIVADGGRRIDVERDALARVTRVTEPGFEHTLRRDPAGRVVERGRGELALRWEYDADGLTTALTHPGGTTTRYERDARGLVARLDHPGLGAVTLERDAAGRLVAATGAGVDLRWRYDAGALAGFSTRGVETTLSRDAAGRVVSAGGDGTWRFRYDEAGQLVAASGPAGKWAFAYDALGRLAEERAGGTRTVYEYDAAGHLVARRGAAGDATFTYDGAGRRLSEEDGRGGTSYAWDAFGRIEAIGATALAVDALGELAEVDGVPLLWTTAEPVASVAWIGGAAVVGAGLPLATVTDGRAQPLALDWMGSAGEARDPWGAPAADGPAIGFRGELEVAGHVWLRERLYAPRHRSFVAPDPLPGVPGAAWWAAPYHYAANDPVGWADPLGLRPVTDEQLREYRDQLGRNVWQQAGHWVGDNYEYIVAGALIVGGVAVALTGVGGPIGAAMISGGLMSAGVSTGMQKFHHGHVDVGRVLVEGVFGAAAGGLGAAAGVGLGMAAGRSSTLVSHGAHHPYVAAGLKSAAESVVGGSANRAFHLENPLRPADVVKDVFLGGFAGSGGRAADDVVRGGGLQPVVRDLTPSAPGGPAPPASREEFLRSGFTWEGVERIEGAAGRGADVVADAISAVDDQDRRERAWASGGW